MYKKLFIYVPIFLTLIIFLFSKNDNNYTIFSGDTINNFDCTKKSINVSKRIIILSETSHGSENIHQLRTCMIKKLILEESYDSIIFEYDFLEISWINDYINSEPTATKEDIKDMLKNSLYYSKSFFDLIDWVKKINSTRKKKVEFFGIDNTNLNFIYHKIKNSQTLEKTMINCVIKNYKEYSLLYEKCVNKIDFKSNMDLNDDEYFLVLLKRALENFINLKNNEIYNENNRDFSMFNTFLDIRKNNIQRKFILSMHTGHSLNTFKRFGSYLKISNLAFSHYILSVCSGAMSSYSYTDQGFFSLKISLPENNLIESSICKNIKPKILSQNKVLSYTSAYSPVYTTEIPSYTFDGFIVVKKSRPLEPPEK